MVYCNLGGCYGGVSVGDSCFFYVLGRGPFVLTWVCVIVGRGVSASGVT